MEAVEQLVKSEKDDISVEVAVVICMGDARVVPDGAEVQGGTLVVHAVSACDR